MADSLPLQRSCPDRELFVHFEKMRLLSGSWLNVRESLWAKASPDSTILVPLRAEDTIPGDWNGVRYISLAPDEDTPR